MPVPYFESNRSTSGSIQYPYECMIQSRPGGHWSVSPHWHLYIEILFFLTGKAKVFLGGESHVLGEGDLILIHSHETHSILSVNEEEVSYMVVKFDPEILYSTSRTILESKYILPFTMAKSNTQRVFIDAEIRNTPVPMLIQEIYEESMSQVYGFELAVRTLICRVFLWFLRRTQAQQPNWEVAHALKETDYQMLQRVFEYIDYNYMYDLSALQAAEYCNMSYSYFSRKFKAIMGKTFTSYLNYIRITEAEKLLLTTDKSMTEVALEVGFSNSSYFIQQFRQIKNISPNQFRKIVGYSN